MSQGLIALILFGSLIIFFLLKVPIAFSLILSSLLVMLLTGTGLEMIPKRLFTSCDSFSFMAVPFFLLAGSLMSQGGISERLCTFINSVFGRFPGGLGIVAIIACAFFAAISGSGAATTAAIGGMMIPEMVKHGYDRNFSAATSASGGCIGTIIPPSIPFVTYGVLTGCSVSTLFMAGFIPGILMAVCLCVAVVLVSKKEGYRDSYRASGAEIWASFKRAFLALLMPVIVLGGIYAGLFTPTEAAVIAVVYGFIVGVFIYRNITPKLLLKILKDGAVSTAQIMILICAASLFGYVLTANRIPDMIAKSVLGLSSSKIVILLLINVLLLIVADHSGSDLLPDHQGDRRQPDPLRHDHLHQPRHRSGHTAFRLQPLCSLRCRRRRSGEHLKADHSLHSRADRLCPAGHLCGADQSLPAETSRCKTIIRFTVKRLASFLRVSSPEVGRCGKAFDEMSNKEDLLLYEYRHYRCGSHGLHLRHVSVPEAQRAAG